MTLNRSEPFGTLSDGTPINSVIDTIRPDVCTGVVWADNDDWHLTAQNDPDLFFIIGENIQLEELTIEQVNRLRALLATDIPEQLIAAAAAYGDATDPDTKRQLARDADRVLATHFQSDDWEMVIGTIDGCEVTAYYDHRKLMYAEMEWHGETISADRDDANGMQLCLPDSGQLSAPLWDWLKELIQSDVADQLIALARANDPAPVERRTPNTLAELPEVQALFDKLSPKAQRVACGLVELMDRYTPKAAQRALDSISAAAPESPAFVDDEPTIRVIDDGQKSGVRVERADRPFGDRAWLDFTAGDVQISADILGGRPGIGLIIYSDALNERIDDVLTLDDVRRLHADLGRLLNDERLIGALREQEAQHDAS